VTQVNFETDCNLPFIPFNIPISKQSNRSSTYEMQHSANNGGVVAAGHLETAQAADQVLHEGGNAFDAAVAAMLAACVAEPVLASLGGGGFLTAKPTRSAPVVYDFFTQTPMQKQSTSAIDFYPIDADFGTASQTFHIGMGSIATPGFIHGIFTVHRDLCRLPLRMLFEPAIQLARSGVIINSFQHLIARIVSPILTSTPAALAINCSPTDSTQLIREGECHRQPELADFLDILCIEGKDLFYRGEAGKFLIDDCTHQGGHLRWNDLSGYEVVTRTPLSFRYRHARLLTNPLPSLGGTLIAFALGLLETNALEPLRPSSAEHLRQLARVMCLTQRLRNERPDDLPGILNPDLRKQVIQSLTDQWVCTRGTTQISIADRSGNLASMTLSNGEGSGYVIPGTGIMLNNMLGEADLNPNGFHQWPQNRRIASMMAPSLVLLDDAGTIVTGSGGSNRIRSAILQVISNLIDFHMPLEDAVSHSRIHFEDDLLSLEPEVDPGILHTLMDEFPNQQVWHAKNLFFGGAHTVTMDSRGMLSGVGDTRRGGTAIVS
jgi:gamma-glutamyltranspeptidase/glutathione hydrolase